MELALGYSLAEEIATSVSHGIGQVWYRCCQHVQAVDSMPAIPVFSKANLQLMFITTYTTGVLSLDHCYLPTLLRWGWPVSARLMIVYLKSALLGILYSNDP